MIDAESVVGVAEGIASFTETTSSIEDDLVLLVDLRLSGPMLNTAAMIGWSLWEQTCLEDEDLSSLGNLEHQLFLRESSQFVITSPTAMPVQALTTM
jgi:hypothetical protein